MTSIEFPEYGSPPFLSHEDSSSLETLSPPSASIIALYAGLLCEITEKSQSSLVELFHSTSRRSDLPGYVKSPDFIPTIAASLDRLNRRATVLETLLQYGDGFSGARLRSIVSRELAAAGVPVGQVKNDWEPTLYTNRQASRHLVAFAEWAADVTHDFLEELQGVRDVLAAARPDGALDEDLELVDYIAFTVQRFRETSLALSAVISFAMELRADGEAALAFVRPMLFTIEPRPTAAPPLSAIESNTATQSWK